MPPVSRCARPARWLLALALVLSLPPAASRAIVCTQILSPTCGTIITDPVCIVTVKVCPVIGSVEFRARYALPDGRTVDTVVATLTARPFTLRWDLRDVPNQLYTGVAISAVGQGRGGQRASARVEGVFFAHRTVSVPSASVSNKREALGAEGRTAMTLAGGNPQQSAVARAYWDQMGLVFEVAVKDTLFNANQPREVLSRAGVEILLDPTPAAKPYPTEATLSLSIPLSGAALRRQFVPACSDSGTYSVGARTFDYPHLHSVRAVDGKGWKALCVVPPAFFNNALTARCNIIVRTPTPEGQLVTLAWAGTGPGDHYAPLVWGGLTLGQQPILYNPVGRWLIAFLSGLGGTVAGFLLLLLALALRRTMQGMGRAEKSRELLEKVKAYAEQKVLDKGTKTDDAALEFMCDAGQIDRLFRKYTGETYATYLMGLRVEVAKERLRSSNATEASVAELSGFRSVEEMERAFVKNTGTTPYKYRLEQQVT
jgi:AraC-like DNA-binding protein